MRRFDRLTPIRCLSEADACFAGGMTQGPSGGVSMTLGYKGLLYLELEVSGDLWGRGPAGMSVHSSLKGCLDSPVNRLAHAVASLTDANGAKVLVRGLDSRASASDEDQELIEELIRRVGEAGVRRTLGLGGVKHTARDLDGRELLLQYLYSPSVNVNGLYAGYTGPGSEIFTVPEKAVARLDLRLPPGLTCEHAVACLRKHLDAHGFKDVAIHVLAASDWSRTPLGADIVQAVLEVYRARGLDPLVWPYQAGGGPWSLFQKELGIPVVLSAGLGGGGNRDRGDEYLLIDGAGGVAGLADAEKSHVDIVHAFARM